MANGWEDEGAWGMASRVPTNAWFPVNTATGDWQLPGQPAPTIGGVTGADFDLGLDLTSPVPGAGQGYGVLAPGTPAIGQVTGLGAPTSPAPSALARPATREPLSAFLPREPSRWENVLRGIGMVTPTGRAILQASDQQQQQQLQNRLALRREQRIEEQDARNAVREEYTAFTDLSKIKNKALRNLQFDRLVARAAEAGRPLPADFVEAFRKSSLVEGEGIAQAYGHLLTQTGFSPDQVSRILEEGDPDTIKGLLEGSLKVQKAGMERDELAAAQRIAQGPDGGTLGDVSGLTPPASTSGAEQRPRGNGASGTTAAAPRSGQPVIDQALEENSRLFNVRLPLLHGIARHESNYNAEAVSPKGATGVMQLMPGTAKEQGVENAKDPLQNVRGGTRYFAQLLTRYNGNEAQALAAYNWGPGNVDKVGADLAKMPAETQAYVKNVLASAASGQRGPAGTSQQVAGTGAPAPAPSAADHAALTRLNKAIQTKTWQVEQYSRFGSEAMNRRADNARSDLQILIQEREKLLETPRAVAKATALQPLELAKQKAGAEVTLEAKMNEPIGTENAIKMNLPAETKWKDVPKGTRVLDRPGEGVSNRLGAYKASHEGITRVIGMLDNPKAISIVGTLLSSEDTAAFRRLAGEWMSSVTPAERKFAAALVAEIAGIRNTISGQAVSAQEAEFLKPMLPSVADPDVATVRAKLEVLQEWIARKHEGERSQLDELGFRTPKALARPAEKPPIDPKAQQALDILKPKGK